MLALAHRVIVKAALGQAGGGADGESILRALVQDTPVPR